MPPSEQPLLFISHKHVDYELAKVLSDFIDNYTAAQLRIHSSSDPDFLGPSAGRVITQELCRTLWETQALILLYTSADQNWSYCLWECGVATNSGNHTNIIVFQCGDEQPAVYEGWLMVKASDLKSIRRFVDQVFRQPNFFAGRDKAVTGFSEKRCDELAEELHKKLGEVIRRLHRSESWSPWPALRLDLPEEEMSALAVAGTLEQIKSVVYDKGLISSYHPGIPQLFGFARIPPEAGFCMIVTPAGKSAEWFESCCAQIADCAANRAPVVRLAYLSSPGGIGEYTPVVTNLRRAYGKRKTEVEITFFNLSDPRGTPVTARMVPSDRMFSRDISDVGQQSLQELIAELDHAKINRLPLLNAGVIQLIVHRSMMEQFLLKRLLAKQPVEDIVLNDLLNDKLTKSMFEAFAIVARRATLAEARIKLESIPNCRDLFVTETGDPAEQVLGYLTNVDVTEATSPEKARQMWAS
jgi:hypothetical protein